MTDDELQTLLDAEVAAQIAEIRDELDALGIPSPPPAIDRAAIEKFALAYRDGRLVDGPSRPQ